MSDSAGERSRHCGTLHMCWTHVQVSPEDKVKKTKKMCAVAQGSSRWTNLLTAHGGTSGWWRCCRWTWTPGTGWTTGDAVQTSEGCSGNLSWTFVREHARSLRHCNLQHCRHHGITYCNNRHWLLVLIAWSILLSHSEGESFFFLISRWLHHIGLVCLPWLLNSWLIFCVVLLCAYEYWLYFIFPSTLIFHRRDMLSLD